MNNKKVLQKLHPMADVDQVGQKQLYLVESSTFTVAYSYRTPVAFKLLGGVWCITEESFSSTTSRHTSLLRREGGMYLLEEDFNTAVAKLLDS